MGTRSTGMFRANLRKSSHHGILWGPVQTNWRREDGGRGVDLRCENGTFGNISAAILTFPTNLLSLMKQIINFETILMNHKIVTCNLRTFMGKVPSNRD